MGLICTCVLDAYPKDENGNNIRPQIDTTIPSVQFVNDLKSGNVQCRILHGSDLHMRASTCIALRSSRVYRSMVYKDMISCIG